ncbi:MAG: cytochrome c biogenesis protein CcsA [Thermomicrobiales bacterium]|nr:cytochrome c biogenesis protein CcsA [Thermomicrobiales bacterium]
MPATDLLRLSYYGFTAASVAVLAAVVFYVMDALWLARTSRLVTAGDALASWRAYATPPTPSGRLASTTVALATLFAGLAVALRALATGRGPYSDMYEFSVAFVFVALLGYFLLERNYGIRPIGVIALPVILGMVAYVWSLPPSVREDRGLIPALSNNVIMTAHVSSAVIAYAAFALSFAAAVLYLVVARWPRAWLPSAELLDEVAFRAVTIGFPAQLLLLILGSVWAHMAWGGYWSWDPKETAALFTWMVYGGYLHARTLRGWRGTRSAAYLVVAFLAVVFTYFGNYWFGGLHAYSGV